MNATLSINVALRLNGEPPAVATARLRSAAAFLAAQGLLTGDGPAEVDCWDSEVQVLEAESGRGIFSPIPPAYKVTTASGPAKWKLVPDLTDRWGMLNYANFKAKQPYLDRLHDDPPLLQRILEQMWDEISSVAFKDDRFGVLFEIDFKTAEVDATDGRSSPQYRPEAELTQHLLGKLPSLAQDFPAVEFCLPQPPDTAEGRVCVWAFVPDGLSTPGEREALGHRLLAL